ncbi:asparagine synthetase B family protein [Rubrivivax gelatinosus]|uniref:asparagine synthase (glutamine-hydrolyzing) n=1 Tax=Rubrivivax gelatinosus (strain NBRC 100245 / IL144) TaxID=983917 RepID=I0HL87_RUBGI|nr:asparagine synthase-related protein [Rubrivivax gelatinosus]BAL93774.1 putative asparagine synthase [Rubrivivax gelatinosus IL144]
MNEDAIQPYGGFAGRFGDSRPETPTVWFAGVLGNAESLAGELGVPPDPVGLVGTGWMRWGERVLWRLHGVFALALEHGDERLLYRDRSGLRNLFFRADGDRLLFASDLAALIAQHRAPPAIRRRSLHEYLRFGDITAPHTMFDGVEAAEPGIAVRWSGGRRRPPAPEATPASSAMAYEEAADEVARLLDEAVTLGLASAQHPAAFLSGGIDSSLLCALAAARRPDVVAVTVGFDTAPFDESGAAQAIARALGLHHETLRFGVAQYRDAVRRLGQGAEQPSADPATPATLLALEHCASRFDVVLDGTGADEALGAMPPRHVRLATQYGSLIPPGWRRIAHRGLRAVDFLSGYAPIIDFEHPADTMIRWRGFTRTEIEALCGEPVSFADTAFYAAYGRYARHEHFARFSALIDTMPCDRLPQAARLSGPPVRYPFCEGRAATLLRGLPTHYRFRPGENKRILRTLLARHLPAGFWDTPKHGFDFPLLAFLQADDHVIVHEHLEASRWRRHGLLDPRQVQSLARRFLAGENGLAFRVWSLIVLDAWLSRSGDR